MLKALGNVAPRHLLDTRLNPPGDLRRQVDREVAPRPAARRSTINLRPVPAVHP
jgi:hypothetical protein